MLKIYLSPSTQDQNVSGTYNEEKAMNLVADHMEELLKLNGFDVKRNDPSRNVGYSVMDANRYKPNLHIALHSNAFKGQTRGMEIWHNTAGTSAAQTIYKALDPFIPAKNRGIKLGSNLYETSKTNHPTILVEYDFHDHVDGAAFILSNILGLAETTVKGICNYFSMPYKETDYTHWAKKSYEFLNEQGLKITEERFDDPIKRGEVFALLERLMLLLNSPNK